MAIDPSLEQGAFGPEATTAMGEAFDAACNELHDAGQFQTVRELVAKRIIAAARRGELDPIRLRTAALSWIITPNVARGFALSLLQSPGSQIGLATSRVIFDPVGGGSLPPEILEPVRTP
jgi:hypothetical protein